MIVPMPHFEGVSVKPLLPGNRPDTTQQSQASSPNTRPATIDTISPEERNNYIQLFQSSGPINGVLPAEKATSIFMRSQLPSSTLQHIWDLADTRKSGSLNQTEFIIAMHYITVIRNGTMSTLPTTLPATIYAAATGRLTSSIGRQNTTMRSPLMRHNTVMGNTNELGIKQRTSSELGRSPTFSGSTQQRVQEDLHITDEEYAKYQLLFQQLAINETGAVSGADAAHFFNHSKLPETDLARIWDLADTRSKGELSEQEFCIAMHLINRRMAGGQIPTILPASILQMIPSSTSNISQQQTMPNPSPMFTDLLGLGDQPPPPPPLQQQQQQQQQQLPQQNTTITSDYGLQNKSSLENNLNSIQSQIKTETSLVDSLQAQQHSMNDTIQVLESTIQEEKKKLENLKHTADELSRHLEAQRKKKEDLTRDLQIYRQESKHYQQRIDQSRQESQDLEKEISDLEKKATTSSQQIPSSSPSSSSISPNTDNANVFALSSTISDHDLFAKVDDTPASTRNSSDSIDPFSAKHQQKKALANATPTLNRLKEANEIRRAQTPNVDISEVEAKFPDLSTMEHDFDTSSNDNKTTTTTPSASTSTNSIPGLSQPTSSPFQSPFVSSSSTPAATKPSKYGFDLSAFEGPSQSTSSPSSVRDDLTSLFGGVSPVQSNNTNIATTSNKNSFDALFNISPSTSSSANQPQTSSSKPTTTSFTDAFFG
ncbi:uncharacterized protein BX664DRAFT_365885 [Halteromyces radiatus]|uniref:uncharacterized protein n=1 Tax=Halteromyces radiatus TaxID=101107 RepID=UPI0022206D5D|nr:uncharacterized protein BX664DRAFT_365885 [Halteromyces radiatus]KAI8086201.1 hypothetical protein BX664DRAFT_365885 [Halteromyces radiatus]